MPSGLLQSLGHAVWVLAKPPEFEAVAPAHVGVRYRASKARGIAPLADVWLPERPSGRSVLVLHGGGFVIGWRRMKPVRFLAARLTAAGIAVCSVDYRMIWRGGRLDESVEDATAAIRWWKTKAATLGLDDQRVALLGISAGATLATLAGGPDHAGGEVDRIVSVFGLYAFDHLRGGIGRLLPRHLLRTRDRGAWAARSPLAAAPARPPVLFVHGTADGLVPVEQVGQMVARRDAAGLESRTLILDDAPHGFLNWVGPAAGQTVAAIEAFLQ